MTPELSVIIPVYNGASYICQAIDSVLNQIGVRTEIIVVNDGSTDDLLDRLAAYEGNISLYSIKHSGLSAARNYGLEKVTCEYVMFLDADDFLLDKNICKECIDRMKAENLELVLFSFQYYNTKSGKFIDAQSYSKDLEVITDSSLLIHGMISTGNFPASACFKVVSYETLKSNNLAFKGGAVAQDVEWFIRLLIAIDRFCLINKPAYIYRKNVADSMTSTMDLEKCQQFLWMINEALVCIKNVQDPIKQNALYSSMAYEYCILIGNVQNVDEGHSMEEDLRGLSWLLNYDSFPRIKYAKWLYRILGYSFTSSLFGLYIRWFAKSNR